MGRKDDVREDAAAEGPDPTLRLPSSVLVVEDNPSDRVLLIEHLKDIGIPASAVTHAGTLDAAREALAQGPVECVLVDLSLPDASGTEGVAVLAACAPDALVIVVTGREDDAWVYASMSEGADEYLCKQTLDARVLEDVMIRADVRRRGRRRRDSGAPAGTHPRLELVDGPTATLDGSGRITSINRAWRQAALDNGIPLSEMGVGVDYLAICDGHDTEGEGIPTAQGIRDVLARRIPSFSADFRRDIGGRSRWFNLRVVPIGTVVPGAIVSHHEITALKLAELSVRSSPRRPSYDQEAAIFVVVDGEGRIARTSSATRALLGLEEWQLVGLDAFEGIDPLDRDRARAAYDAVQGRPGASESLEVRALDGDGRWRDLDVLVINMAEDPEVGGTVITGWDRSRTRLEQISRSMELSVLRRLPVAVVVLDERFVVSYWNDRAGSMFGVDPDDAIGRSLLELGLADGESGIHAEIGRHLVEAGSWEGEYDATRSDGSHVALHLQADVLDLPDIGFRGIVGAAVDISDRKTLEDDLQFQALHDPLTGLANRRLITGVLDASLERADQDHMVAVLFVDLDDFGAHNEALGHLGGDQLLQEVARQLEQAVRPGDSIARLGGDEFVVCCPDIPSMDTARSIAERILDQLGRLGGDTTGATGVAASIGIATGIAGIRADAVLRNADVAMYDAKERGKGRVEVFDDDLHLRLRRWNDVATQLAASLERGEVHAHFQPQYDLRSGALFGFEALARWSTAAELQVEVMEFIEIAEASGLVVELGRQMLAQSCAALVRWRELRPDLDLTVSVNVSGRQLDDPAFPTEVRSCLVAHGVEPSRVILEVTESSLTDAEAASVALRRLKAVGVQIAVDDFGTGYSSLSRLHRFPLDHLKIDRSFVNTMSQPGGESIVRAVLHLAQERGLSTVAEGIETQEQHDRLRAMGWTLGQGFLWRPACHADDADEVVARAQRSTLSAPEPLTASAPTLDDAAG